MKLTKISARNFKGVSFEEKLLPVTVFGGTNFAGKSARLDAIRLLLLGYLPELGKQAKATFGLSSGSEMAVSGVLEERSASGALLEIPLNRRWTLKGDSVKSEKSLALEKLEADGRLTVMLDGAAYFSMTDRGRVEYLFKNTRMPAGWTPGGVRDRIQIKVQGFPPSLLIELTEALGAAIDAGAVALDPDMMDALILAAETFEKSERDFAARMEKTVQGLAALRAADAPADPDGPLQEEEGRLTAQLADLKEAQKDLQRRFNDVRTARLRRDQINRELSMGDPAQKRKAALEEALKEAEGRLELVSPPAPEALNSARDELLTVKAAEIRVSQELISCQRIVFDARAEMDGISKQISCPYCGAAGEGWKLLSTEQLKEKIRTAEAATAVIIETQEGLRGKKQLMTDVLETGSQQTRRHAELTESRARITAEIAGLATQLARSAVLSDELARLLPDDPELETAAKMVQLRIDQTAQDISATVTKRAAVSGRAQDLKRLAEAEIARDKALRAKEVGTVALEELRKIKGEMVDDALVPLLAAANQFFPEVLKTPLAYHGGEIGTWRGAVWVAHHTFSGVEKALAYAAIQAALAEQAPVKIMIVDEMARVHDDYLAQFFGAVVRAVKAGKLDGFIGVDPSRPAYYEQMEKLLGDNVAPALLFRIIK